MFTSPSCGASRYPPRGIQAPTDWPRSQSYQVLEPTFRPADCKATCLPTTRDSTTWVCSSPLPTQGLLLFKPQLLHKIISNHHSSHFDIPFYFPCHQSSMKARSVFYTFISPNFRNTLDTKLLLNRFIIMNFLNETIAPLHIKILSIVCPPHQNLEALHFV